MHKEFNTEISTNIFELNQCSKYWNCPHGQLLDNGFLRERKRREEAEIDKRKKGKKEREEGKEGRREWRKERKQIKTQICVFLQDTISCGWAIVQNQGNFAHWGSQYMAWSRNHRQEVTLIEKNFSEISRIFGIFSVCLSLSSLHVLYIA